MFVVLYQEQDNLYSFRRMDYAKILCSRRKRCVTVHDERFIIMGGCRFTRIVFVSVVSEQLCRSILGL